MNLPLVNTFVSAYEAWETRSPTREEMLANRRPDGIKVSMFAKVSSATEAATYIAKVGEDNGLSSHIQTALKRSAEYRAWQSAMPPRTPKAIARYQKDYEKSDLSAVSKEIETYGVTLSVGQRLYHGGRWWGGDSQITTRPLSTSLCPQVALRNVEWGAKAYDAGRIDLFVLRIASSTNKVFVFKRRGTSLGHESEVLITSGARLTLVNQTLVRSEYPAAKWNAPNKEIPIFVLEMEVS